MRRLCLQSFANLISSCIVRPLLTLSIVTVFSTLSIAQDIQYTQSIRDQNKRSGLTVDPSSLGLNLQIPLAEYAGRGASVPIALQFSSKVWRMEYGGNAGLNPHANGWVYPVYAPNGGWTTSLGVPILRNSSTQRPYNSGGNPATGGQYIVFGMQVQMPDGSSHQLRKDDYSVLVDAYHPYNSDGTYYAVDGSHLRLDYHTGVNAPPNVLYLPDGSRYLWTADSNGYDLISYIDRNGNTLVYSRNQSGQYQWSDTLGRIFSLPFPANQSFPTIPTAAGDTTYSLPGTGNSSLAYTFRWRNLADIRTDPSQPLRYEALYNQCDFDTAIGHSPSLFGTGTVCDGDDFTNQLFNPVLLSEIVLPNGKSYKFTYNVFGEMDKVVYPTGGYERFQYDTLPLMSYVRGYYAQANRGVVDRWTSIDGSGADENIHHWHYAASYTNNAPPYVVTDTAPDGSYSQRYVYASQNRAPFSLEDVRVGRAYEERAYSASGQMLRRTLTDWIVSGPMSGGQPSATRNPRVSKQVDILLDTGGDALAKTTTFGYDATYEFTIGVEPTSINEFDFAGVNQATAQSGASSDIPVGSLLRTNEKSYLDYDANYRSRNLIGLITSARVKDSGGNIVAQSTISYDEASYPLLTYGGVTSWTDPQTNVRGNPTTVSYWLNTTSSWLQKHVQYDQCGNARNSWDAKGNESQVEYSSNYAYAYPTLTRTAVPDPTGQNGSTTALVSISVFDFNTGLATSATDANSFASIPEYNDPLLRQTRGIHASGNSAQTQSAMEYDDTNRIVTGKSDLNNFNDSALKAKTLMDGIGRMIEARTYESDTNYIAVQTQYDSMGRAYQVSNPFRPWQSESPVWTTNSFDALGRVISVTTPDGAVVASSYSGNTVTVTDQAGKKRRRVTDALGRLIRVDEPDPNGNLDVNGVPAQSTNYAYDALDNLIQVTQGSQTRTFVYDSLKRLTTATNPESGTVSYQYDGNGNLTQKTDARGVVATYAYDALNRNISVTYTNDPANTPAVTRTYDGASNGLGRLWKTETASSSRTTIDSYDALGRPTVQRQQFYANGAWSASFQTSAAYDKAGHILTLTYPSQHVVNYNFDSAGRLSDNAQGLAFTGNLGDGTTRTYSAGISYDNASRWTREQFGTDTLIYNKRHYNIRGQLYDMRASTVNDDSNWNRGAIVNYYNFQNFGFGTSGTDNNGNVIIQQHWIPTDNQISGYSVHQQNYAYDSLNRISWVGEYLNAAQNTGSQGYGYDRYGNRYLYGSGAGINNQQFSVDANTNRLGVPSGQYGTMTYDQAGNLTYDSYSGEGPRTYDAENRMTQAWAYNRWQTYTYDGNGKRTRRNIDGSETWQVYGLGGELLAEYSASAAPTSPQKEYGYRNGELLITAAGASCGVGNTGPQTWLGTDGHLGHLTGHAEGTNWAVYAGSDSPTAMVFGPYDATYGQGHHTVQFQLMVDNNSGSDVVATLDVVTGFGGNVLATRQVRRSDFSAANQWQTFTLQFDNPCFGSFEARVWWAGNASMKFAQLTITPLNVASSGVQWLVTDQLGTPRMVFDKTGSLSGMSRHDYLPFGEELSAGVGGRTAQEGYNTDNVRQHFTQKERDNETGLDYFGARYYASTQGRFIGSDPTFGSLDRPATWNAYTYAGNNPLNRIDPDGARDVPANVKSYVFANLRYMFQVALAADVSVGGVLAIGGVETQWGTSNAYKHKHNPGGMSVNEVPLSYASLDEGYFVMSDLLCGRYSRVAGIHDAKQFIDEIENDHNNTVYKWNSAIADYADIAKNAIRGFGLDFFDQSVLTPLRNGRDVKFNGVTVSSTAELDRLMRSDQPGDQIMVEQFFAGVYQGWLEYVRNIGTERDPNVQRIRQAFALPGSDPMAEEEALYEYRVGRAFSGE